MVVNYIANAMTFVYSFTMGQNVRRIMSKYNVTHHELLHIRMSAIKYKCKEMWKIYVNAAYYHYANMICESVVMGYCNNGAVLTKENSNAVISYLSPV